MKNENSDRPILFIVYELGHVDELKKYFEMRPTERVSSVVVALSIDIEEKLQKEGIPFVSGGLFKKVYVDQLQDEDRMMDTFFADPRWEHFVYRDIHVPRIFQFMFRAYLQVVRYHALLLISIVDAHPGAREIKLFRSNEVVTGTHGTLAFREIHVLADCAQLVGSGKGVVVTILPPSIVLATVRNSMRAKVFSFKRALFGLMLRVWNRAVVILAPPSPPRFLISDHWRNIQSVAPFLKNGEFIFLDRTEIRNISFRLLLKYRMRFVHITDFLSRKGSRRVQEISQKLREKWLAMERNMPKVFAWEGQSFDELFATAMHDIVLDFPRILSQIEGTYAMYEKLRPHVVELRASVSKQTHFSILALVAKKQGIPSLELQHGVEYLGPGSWSREHEAEYIALYGSLVKKEMLSLGYGDEKLALIGSPRFDRNINLIEQYRRENKKSNQHEKIRILCIAPDIRAHEIYDSYSASDYFVSVAKALEPEKENVHIVIKLRPGPAQENILRLIIARAFSGFSYTIMHNEPLSVACKGARMAISCYSTALLEVLQFEIPTVIPALHPVDAQIVKFHFSPYGDAGALSLVSTPGDLSHTLSQFLHDEKKLEESRRKIRSFLARNFCFDGKSSERYATLMSELAEPRSGKSHDIHRLRKPAY